MRECRYCHAKVSEDATECFNCKFPLGPAEGVSADQGGADVAVGPGDSGPTPAGDFLLKFGVVMTALALVVGGIVSIANAISLRSGLLAVLGVVQLCQTAAMLVLFLRVLWLSRQVVAIGAVNASEGR